LRNRALGYLARREYAVAELHRKLLPYAESVAELESLISDLKSEDYLSDLRFAQQFTEIRGRRFGVRRIGYELKQRGVSDEIIETLLVQMKREEFNGIKNVWLKKFGHLAEDYPGRMKQQRFLQQRGFSTEAIQRLFSALGDKDGLNFASMDEIG